MHRRKQQGELEIWSDENSILAIFPFEITPCPAPNYRC
jgi:hypothetical protein